MGSALRTIFRVSVGVCPEYTFVCAAAVYKCDVTVVCIIYAYMCTYIYMKRESGDIVFWRFVLHDRQDVFNTKYPSLPFFLI